MADRYFPARQLVHEDDPALVTYCPDVHGVHEVVPALDEYWPAAQVKQEDMAMEAWYCPEEQGVHAERSTVPPY